MRAAPLLLALLLASGPALAGGTTERTYVMTGRGGGLGSVVVFGGLSIFPDAGATSLTATASDLSGETVSIGICHEWSYHDGRHPTVRCVFGCDTLTDALGPPPDPTDTVYRVLVHLYKEPHGCGAGATAGRLRVVVT